MQQGPIEIMGPIQHAFSLCSVGLYHLMLQLKQHLPVLGQPIQIALHQGVGHCSSMEFTQVSKHLQKRKIRLFIVQVFQIQSAQFYTQLPISWIGFAKVGLGLFKGCFLAVDALL